MKDCIVLMNCAIIKPDISWSRIYGIRIWQKEVTTGIFRFEDGTYVWGKIKCSKDFVFFDLSFEGVWEYGL